MSDPRLFLAVVNGVGRRDEPTQPPPVDPPGGSGDDGSMNERLARLEAIIDELRTARAQEHDDAREFRTEVRAGFSEMRADFSGVRTTTITTGVAVFLGLAAVAIAIVQTVVAGFESGRNTAALVEQVRQENAANSRRLDEVADRLKAQPTPASGK